MLPTIPSKVKTSLKFSGIDNIDKCRDKKHFEQYPYKVEYNYNSKGFRDTDWPDDLKSAIWCVGDSYTVGIGSPREHTWPALLEKKINKRTINISLDGASNNWISRTAVKILQEVQPAFLVIQWSFINRREASIREIQNIFFNNFYNKFKDPSWPDIELDKFYSLPDYIKQELKEHKHNWMNIADDNRLIHFLPNATNQDDFDNLVQCIDAVVNTFSKTKIIHGFVPQFAQNETYVHRKLTVKNKLPILEIKDYARDGYHYDKQTATVFVNEVIKYIDK